VPELSLDDVDWDSFSCHLDGMRMTKLMGSEPAPNAGLQGGFMKGRSDL
jgi:hypothetical protein